MWDGRFVAPVSGGITSPFGLRRVVNGWPRSPHGGVDLKAASGTEILAANHGRVVLREEFFFSGKSLVLDHGGGLYTMYFHLADFRVEKDSQVRKGDLIGWAGKTGRVTGPHLHWGVRLNGARVDPFELLEATGDGSTALSGSSTEAHSKSSPPKGRQQAIGKEQKAESSR
ncbi:MAG: M23 family metallopeptidase [Deltaproteobacteria bacterium]|nr:M23 family metallopeptidase [Deltaproteobacteria bacterium]